MPLTRRQWLAGCAAAAVVWPTAGGAHTPYRQWVVYRQKHLLIGAHRGDGRTYALAKVVVAALSDELPGARARVARGPRPQRIASLIGTGQMMTAVLSVPEAQAMRTAAPPFQNYMPTPLVTLVALDGDYQLVASPDLPDDHAWLLTEALFHAKLGRRPPADILELHAGAAAFWNGGPRPS